VPVNSKKAGTHWCIFLKRLAILLKETKGKISRCKFWIYFKFKFWIINRRDCLKMFCSSDMEEVFCTYFLLPSVDSIFYTQTGCRHTWPYVERITYWQIKLQTRSSMYKKFNSQIKLHTWSSTDKWSYRHDHL
jgi:hypothetical protein